MKYLLVIFLGLNLSLYAQKAICSFGKEEHVYKFDEFYLKDKGQRPVAILNDGRVVTYESEKEKSSFIQGMNQDKRYCGKQSGFCSDTNKKHQQTQC